MYVRLAFAVAAHLDLEILLVDEVLAVGDFAFQQKCLGKMGDIAHSGRTVLLVSHNLAMLSNLSTRAVWLNRGRIQEWGTPQDVIASYCKHIATTTNEGSSVALAGHPGRRGGYQCLLERVTLLDDQNTPTSSVRMGGTLSIELELTTPTSRAETGFVIDICDQFGSVLAQANSRVQSRISFAGAGCRKVRCGVGNVRLVPGNYLLNVGVGDGEDYLDRVDGALRFSVEPTDVYGTGHVPSSRHGLIALETQWLTEDAIAQVT
jgi:lipopolysaccharide transport system ATP-binding protein